MNRVGWRRLAQAFSYKFMLYSISYEFIEYKRILTVIYTISSFLFRPYMFFTVMTVHWSLLTVLLFLESYVACLLLGYLIYRLWGSGWGFRHSSLSYILLQHSYCVSGMVLLIQLPHSFLLWIMLYDEFLIVTLVLLCKLQIFH